eukprot:Em0022g927a
MRRFRFDRFDNNIEEWDYYIQRFENELAVHGLLTGEDSADARKNLLLSKIGPEAFKIVVDYFCPDPVGTKSYQQLIEGHVGETLFERYVEETALVLEQALIQQQQLHGMAKGDGITKSEVCRVKKGEEGNRTQKKLQKGELFQAIKGITAKLSNGVTLVMLYDPGAARSVITKKVWSQIGCPKLKSAGTLVAYSGVAVDTLGETKVEVEAFGKRKRLSVMVAEIDDTPLFGLDWCLSFDIKMPPGVSIHHVRSDHMTQGGSLGKEIEGLLTQFKDLFSEEPGVIVGHKAVVHLKEGAVPRVCSARPVPFPIKGAVEAELDRLVKRNILEPVDTTVTPIEAMDTILADIGETAVYIDDIIVGGKTKEEHVKLLHEVFGRLRQANIRPWARIHIDYAGPFEGKYWLIVIDAYSKWLEIVSHQSITTLSTIKSLREIFSRFGVPKIIVSDNGTQFASKNFEAFCYSNNIIHAKSTPYHPKTNGLAERAVRTFKGRMKASKGSAADWELRLKRFLIAYRNTPQKSTGRAPAELLIGWKIRTKLDLLKPDVSINIDKAVIEQKLHHDKHAKPKIFTTGQHVWVQNITGKGYQAEHFLNSAALAAMPEYMPASVITLELSGDVTVTSKAAEMPLSQMPLLTSRCDDKPALRESIEEHITYSIMPRSDIAAALAGNTQRSSGYCISLSCQSPIIEIPTVQQHIFALGVSRDFKDGAVQNEGKKKTQPPMDGSLMHSDNCSVTSKVYLLAAVNAYNAMVRQPDAISVESVLDVPHHQHALSSLIEEADFNSLFSDATTVTKARLQAISAPQAHAWLKVQPSPKLGLALMPDEAQVILKWWLGLPLTPEGTPCPLCHHNMDAWGHHMLTCRSGGDVITRHNQLRDCIADVCHKANLSPQIEKGSGILPKDQSRPADILVPKVINPLN